MDWTTYYSPCLPIWNIDLFLFAKTMPLKSPGSLTDHVLSKFDLRSSMFSVLCLKYWSIMMDFFISKCFLSSTLMLSRVSQMVEKTDWLFYSLVLGLSVFKPGRVFSVLLFWLSLGLEVIWENYTRLISSPLEELDSSIMNSCGLSVANVLLSSWGFLALAFFKKSEFWPLRSTSADLV